MSIHHLIHSHFIFLLVIPVILLIYVLIKKARNKEAPKEISKEKFETTMVDKMIDIPNSEHSMYNIWPYVNDLKKAHIISKKIEEDKLIHKVYRNANFEHILLNTEKENDFVVIIVNLNKHKVKGYYLIDFPNSDYPL
jgi:hypothetical protein